MCSILPRCAMSCTPLRMGIALTAPGGRGGVELRTGPHAGGDRAPMPPPMPVIAPEIDRRRATGGVAQRVSDPASSRPTSCTPALPPAWAAAAMAADVLIAVLLLLRLIGCPAMASAASARCASRMLLASLPPGLRCSKASLHGEAWAPATQTILLGLHGLALGRGGLALAAEAAAEVSAEVV